MAQTSFTPGSHYAFPHAIPPADTAQVRRKWLDIPYATHSPQQKLDVYLPQLLADSYPVIVAIHGGAFMGGDKADAQLNPMLQALKRGYAVVSINYRMSWEAIFPALVHDAKAAVRWIRAQAAQYGFDADKIAAWGGSAGGYLSAMLGTTAGVKALEDLSLGNADESSHVQAVVDWFGPTDFLQMDAQFAADEVCPASAESHDAADSPESMLLGAEIQSVPDLADAANPITYVTEDDPPFFIQHGTADCNVPTAQSQLLYDALVEATGEENNTFIIIEGAGHGGEQFSAEDNFALVIAFLDQHLK